MTQPFTSDDSLPTAQRVSGQGKLAEARAELLSTLPDSEQPAIRHPNFDPKQTPIDPARPLTDIPEPARRVNGQLQRLYGKAVRFSQPDQDRLSKWQLLASEPLAEHLQLLTAAKLIDLPISFYRRYRQPASQNAQPLLTALEHMTLLDLADIQRAISHYPKLSRYGFIAASSATITSSPTIINSSKGKSDSLRALAKSYDPDELLSSLYADDWQVILQPEQFEMGMGSLTTDIMACSVAVHALSQCATRKSINQSYSAAQLCQYVRSYLLSQIGRAPTRSYAYRQIRLFTGHIIVAAYHLGWEIQVHDNGDCYFNISSRCSLLTRYANMPDYHINGWSS